MDFSNIFWVTGQTTDKIVINKAFFSNVTGIVRVKLDITSNGRTGTGSTQLITNHPPEGGSCRVFPLEGEYLVQTFTLTCDGWVDPDGGKIKHYKFFGNCLPLKVLYNQFAEIKRTFFSISGG